MKKSIKKNLLYDILLNLYRIRHSFKNIGQEFGFWDTLHLTFLNFIGQRDKIVYLKNLDLYVKPNFFVITTLIEVFNRKLYKNLTGLDCVLDLGAYIGESAVYLSRYNKKVIAYEPSQEKFSLLEKNISQHECILGFNTAVVEDKNIKVINFHERDPFDFCSSSHYQKKLDQQSTVACIDIYSVLDRYPCDGLKMDIEGGEYPILQGLLKHGKFTFSKGVIEFHFSGNDRVSRINEFKNFHSYLTNNNYLIRCYNNQGSQIKIDEGMFKTNENIGALNLEFELG